MTFFFGGGAVCRATHLYSRAAFRDAILCLGCVLPGCPVDQYVYGLVLWSAPPPLVTEFSTVIILFSCNGWPWSIRSNLFFLHFSLYDLTCPLHTVVTFFFLGGGLFTGRLIFIAGRPLGTRFRAWAVFCWATLLTSMYMGQYCGQPLSLSSLNSPLSLYFSLAMAGLGQSGLTYSSYTSFSMILLVLCIQW